MFPDPKNNLSLFWYLRDTSCEWMHKIIEIQHRSQTQFRARQLDAELLSLIPRQGAWWRHSHCWGCVLPWNSSVQHKWWTLFLLFAFFHESKSSLDLFWLAKIGLVKVKWCNANFPKNGGYLYISRLDLQTVCILCKETGKIMWL